MKKTLALNSIYLDFLRFTEYYEDYKAADKHMVHKQQCKDAERDRVNNFPGDLMVVTCDFKEPIIVGKSPEEKSDQVFNYCCVTCFGVTLEDFILLKFSQN